MKHQALLKHGALERVGRPVERKDRVVDGSVRRRRSDAIDGPGYEADRANGASGEGSRVEGGEEGGGGGLAGTLVEVRRGVGSALKRARLSDEVEDDQADEGCITKTVSRCWRRERSATHCRRRK